MVESMNDKPALDLNGLIEAAKSEDWEAVDGSIASLSNDQNVLDWALQTGIDDEDGNLRDLGVSILERSSYELEPADEVKLNEMLKEDENPYVQFRAAFTLFNRGDRSTQVLDKMREALGDEDVKEIAQNYLNPQK